MAVSPDYNNNDSQISRVCMRLLHYLEVHGKELEDERLECSLHRPQIVYRLRLLDESVDMLTNEPTGRCATFAISYSAGSHRCV
jgi:hypothetical protein